MAYTLLTGATGLLGRYLLKDLLLAEVPVAALVRSGRKASAQQRIENVMCYWDEQLGRSMPRPIVLEGDITEPDLGLDARGMRWVAENCDSLMHNAASLEFVSTSPESEPWRSNVKGTRNMLELCRNARIRKLHHVSTAYVCGLRTGRILESELDVGQQMSNDYEQSKVQAEKMVRSADFIDELTVYRPAIIIGDAQNGYTTTFHGFYVPLNAVCTIAGHQKPNETGLLASSARFALTGAETKNLVPVDWVSAVMSHVFTHPAHHQKTYHLTPRHPITIRLLADILEEIGGFYGVRLQGAERALHGITENEGMFTELISIYSSYWRDDPTFDYTNTRTAAPHLPCPHIDRDLLLRMARYAVGINFNSPRDRLLTPRCDLRAALEPLLENPQQTEESTAHLERFGLQVLGHGGGQWQFLANENAIVSADLGIPDNCETVLTMDIEEIGSLLERKATAEQVVADKQVRTIPATLPHSRIAQTLQKLVDSVQSRTLVSP
jgi:thioester reductase-like protein